MVVHLDKDCTAQKNLIHACIDAGVKRFAPSEWAIRNGSGIAHYENKDAIAEYLAELNKEKKVSRALKKKYGITKHRIL